LRTPTETPRGSWRRWVSPEALLSTVVVALFVLGVAGLEWALRVAAPDYLYRLKGDTATTVYSEVYGWTLREGFRGDDNGAWTTINAHGHRGEDYSAQKTSGRTRVLMLGDSITYGLGVEDRATFSALVHQRDPRFEVLNLGVGGYGTDQELIQLEGEGLRYKPDVVVLNFCLFSDFTDNALSSNLFDARQPKPYYTWDGHALVLHNKQLKLSWFRRGAQWLTERSHLYNRLLALSGAPRPDRRLGAWSRRIDKVMRDLPAVADLTFRLIRMANDESRHAGARFLVLIHPDESAFQDYATSDLMERFCATPLLDGITVVDMAQMYRARGLEWSGVAMDPPGHLTPLGHQVAADVMAALLSHPVPEDWDYRRICRSHASP
jgi:hypothetical protein